MYLFEFLRYMDKMIMCRGQIKINKFICRNLSVDRSINNE